MRRGWAIVAAIQAADPVALAPFAGVLQDELSSYKLALGNLCLLYRVLNSMVGDKPYAVKTRVYERKGQYLLTRAVRRSIAEGVDTKYTRIERRLKHFSKWTPKSDRDRTKHLEALAADLWDL